MLALTEGFLSTLLQFFKKLSKTVSKIKCNNNLYYILPQDSVPGKRIIIASGIYFLVPKNTLKILFLDLLDVMFSYCECVRI